MDVKNIDTYNLTIDDFRFSKIRMCIKAPKVNRKQILITLTKANPTYNMLSSLVHRSYIEHNIPEINNSAPTVEQYWQELMVYKDDIEYVPSKHLQQKFTSPSTTFFKNANLNFASSNNARYYKYASNLKPKYYYHINTDTKQPEYLPIVMARKFYCKAYEQDIMNNNESKSLFLLLLNLCKTRDKSFPIIVRGYTVIDNLDNVTNIESLYKNKDIKFGHEYCLVEMLIHYPNLNECVWNKT